MLQSEAFVLHRYAYKDTSVLMKLFTKNDGVVACIARGAKRLKSPWRSLVHPFKPILVSLSGRTDLKTLRFMELSGSDVMLTGNALASGFYLNELLVNFLMPHDPQAELFSVYIITLLELSLGNILPALRRFEWQLLRTLGYAPDLSHANGVPIKIGEFYKLAPGQSLERVAPFSKNQPHVYSAKVLQAISAQQFTDKAILGEAKRLNRAWIDFYLEGKVLKSRELFYVPVA